MDLCTATSDQPGTLPVPHPDFFQAATLSTGEIILNDAKMRMAVEAAGQDCLKARITRGGEISPNKSITFSSCEYRKESLSARDQVILVETQDLPFIQYAISYVKDAAEMTRYRAVLGSQAAIIAKLERKEAVEEALQVTEAADEVWLCRGDLGAELGMKAMAEATHRFAGQLSSFTKPVLLAGQVLEHMTEHPEPTRSEICYLFDALANGYRGIVLSDETAIGRDPVESCRMAAMLKP